MFWTISYKRTLKSWQEPRFLTSRGRKTLKKNETTAAFVFGTLGMVPLIINPHIYPLYSGYLIGAHIPRPFVPQNLVTNKKPKISVWTKAGYDVYSSPIEVMEDEAGVGRLGIP